MKHVKILRGITPLLVFAAVVTMCFLSSCGMKHKYEYSTVIIDEEASSLLSVEVKDADSSGGVFTFANCCDKVLSYGDRNLLEKNIAGEWQGVVSYNQRTMIEPSYELEPGESVEYETDWSSLDAGDYRYVVPFTVLEGEGFEPPRVYYVAAFFTI